MGWPTTLDALTASSLSEVLGYTVVDVSVTPLGEPWTSWVAGLEVSGADGRTESLVAKVARPDRGNATLYRQEIAFYRHLAGRLDCVPRPRFAEIDDDGRFLLLLERVPGRHLRHGFDEATARASLTAIARVHGTAWGDETLAPRREHSAALATRLVEGMHAGWDDVARRFPTHLGGPPPLDDLAAEVGRLRATTLTHNDLHAENVLVDGGRVVFVDWQNATYSTPMLDVANLIAGCVQPGVQCRSWRALLAHYEAALQAAGGPALPDAVAQYATTTGLLFGWMMRYLAGVSDDEAAGRSMLLAHWERVCTGVVLPR